METIKTKDVIREALIAPLPKKSDQQAASIIDQIIAQFRALVGNNDLEAAKRVAQLWACMAPDSPNLINVANALRNIEDQEFVAWFSRMGPIFDPENPLRRAEIIHRGIKAGRPDLMPRHWTREIVAESQKLKAYIKDGDLTGAKTFIDQANLVGNRYYLPEFRALKHFVRFNTESEYKKTFTKHCVLVLPIFEASPPDVSSKCNEDILQSLIRLAKWADKVDTIVPGKGLNDYPVEAQKRIRASRLSPKDFPDDLMTWRKSIESRCVSFWFHLIKNDLTKDLYGIDSRYAAEAEFDVRYHINEILAGPVLGPHYHSGSAGYDIAAYPLASAVYYPRTVPEDHASKAGYLELGRPNFGTVFEPETLAIRPVAGHIVMFPAFAFHGVVPINQSPRYSINIDLHARRKGSRDNSILGFFD